MPTPRLIKENHLDPEFLRRLLTGGNSASFDAALTEYVKKTDKITKSQIHQDYLNEVNDAIAAVEAKLANYYNKLDPISRENIDSDFESDIATLEIAVSRFNQIAENLEDTVASTVNDYLNNSSVIPDITETVRVNVQETVDGMSQTVNSHTDRIAALEIKADTLESGLGSIETGLDTASQNIQTAQNNIVSINDSLNSINATLDRIQNIDAELNNFKSLCAETYRKLSDPIPEADLDPAVLQAISDLQAAVAALQEIDFSPVVKVEGSAGQVATIDYQGSLVGADLVYFGYAFDSIHEVTNAQFHALNPIIDLNYERVLEISHAEWDEAAKRNQQKETVPLLGSEERVTAEDINIEEDITEEDVNWPKNTDESDYQIVTLSEANINVSVESVEQQPESQTTPEEPTETNDSDDDDDQENPEEPEPEPTLTIQNEEIIVSNPFIDRKVYLDIGFYGKQFKLYGKITSEDGFEAVLNIDSKKDCDITYGSERAGADSVCVLCIEHLSEGPHRIRFQIEPEGTLRISTKFKINAANGALLFKEDIFPDFFWDEDLYDGGDYFHNYTAEETDAESIIITHSYPDDLKSDAVEQPGPDWYLSNELDYSDIKYIGKFICNKETRDLYYCDGSSMIKMLEYPRIINQTQMEAIIDAILGDDDEDEPETPIDPGEPEEP